MAGEGFGRRSRRGQRSLAGRKALFGSRGAAPEPGPPPPAGCAVESFPEGLTLGKSTWEREAFLFGWGF